MGHRKQSSGLLSVASWVASPLLRNTGRPHSIRHVLRRHARDVLLHVDARMGNECGIVSSLLEEGRPRPHGCQREFVVAGVSLQQDVVHRLCVGAHILLERDDYNRSDPSAVKVLKCQGREMIGHIRRKDTGEARRMLEEFEGHAGSVCSLFPFHQDCMLPLYVSLASWIRRS